MTTLLIDIGNTRIKWARFDGVHVTKGQAAAHGDWRRADYARRLFAPTRALARAVVASVAGDLVDGTLAAAAREARIATQFVAVPRLGGGVTVGYAEPWRLGVDRYVALVGAHALFRAVPVCVVGVGTAMTIDLVDADGRHRGGVIIPAPNLMVETLLTRTSGIRRRAQGGAVGGRSIFGRSTRDAIELGSRYAAAALIDRAVEEASGILKREPLVLLTGGEATAVRPLMRSTWVGVPDLVLRGLAVLARTGPPRARRR